MNESRARTWAMITHLSTLAAYTGLGFVGAGVIAPLVIWLIQKKESPFVDRNGCEAINFNLTILIVYLVLIAATIATLGFAMIVTVPLGFVLTACHIGFSILAGVRANEGVEYRYPLTIRFLKPTPALDDDLRESVAEID